MASLFKDITPSHYVDGTYISKYSEKVLNDWAKWIYYAGLIGAILAILVGIYLLFHGFYYAILSASHLGYYNETPGSAIGFGFLGLFLSVLYALASYGAGVIISSSIRVLCNISLSLKMLNDKGVIQQPIQKQQSSGITGNTHNNSPVTCPECGHSCEKGLSACPNCGYPFD